VCVHGPCADEARRKYREDGKKKRRVCYAVALAIQPSVSPGGFGYL
jgi:hypothetical protein